MHVNFNDFDEIVTYDKNMFHGRIIDDFPMILVHTNLYSGQVEGAFGLFGNSIDTDKINVNISDSNCDHESSVEDVLFSNCDHTSCVEDELLSNCDTKESVDDETNSNCDTCLVEDESVRLSGKNTISLDFVNHDHMCLPFCLENDFVT